MKSLVIVESPSKSKTIEKYLGKDFKVVSSKGHIRDLATRGKDGLGVDVENNFEATYIINKDKKDVVKELKALAPKYDKIYLATDPDREGEAISWHLAQELEVDEKEKNRVIFNEITKDAVLEAFKTPRTIDENLVKSQETRRILDRIIGFKLSKLLKNKIRSKSAGRVQSVALKIIVEREKLIQAFIPEEYWSIKALFKESKTDFEASLEKYKNKKLKLNNKDETVQVLNQLEGPFTLEKVKKSTRKKEAYLVFTTSTLQQTASSRLNFNAKKTMRVAQKLYEGISLGGDQEGLITYMRTDSTRMSPGFVDVTLAYIKDTYGKEYVGRYRAKKNSANTQDAHEGIRVTDITRTPESIKSFLSNDEFKLYSLIYARSLASLMAPARQETLAYTFNKNDYQFVANGIKLVFDGYTKAYGKYESTKDNILPELVEGETYQPTKIEDKQHFTEPPLRFNEARLIKELEENGIGRPSTYSTIIDTIVSRGYVEYKAMSETSKAKVFVPTDQGILTDEKLAENFGDIINVKYTANMEETLDKIADGDIDNIEQLRTFYDKFDPLVQKAYDTMEKAPLEYIGEACPEDGGQLVMRYGRFGKFIACENYPSCKYHRPTDDKKKEPPVSIGVACPTCGNDLVVRTARRTGKKFVGCSTFPKCRYVDYNYFKKDQEDDKTKKES